jgi:hypothetical protein
MTISTDGKESPIVGFTQDNYVISYNPTDEDLTDGSTGEVLTGHTCIQRTYDVSY